MTEEVHEKKTAVAAVQKWAIGNKLQNVESIIYDSIQKVYYASCGKEYSTGKQGYIAKLALDGSILKEKWIKNLHRPTGMAIKDSALYVADINRLLVIDLNTSDIMDSIPESVQKSGLNDVTINEEQRIFVTASFVNSVFELVDGKLKLLVEDEENLKWANGIASDGTNLIVGGAKLVKINTKSKSMHVLSTKPNVLDFDGIVADGKGGLYVTTVDNSALWYINGSFEASKIASDSCYFGDLDYVTKGQSLVIARGCPSSNTFFVESRPLPLPKYH